MKHLVRSVVFTALLVFLHMTLSGQEDAREVFRKATGQILTENMELMLEMNIKDKKGRVKEKGYEILVARFGDVEKTKMCFQKPIEAKGTTVIFTELPGENGLIEVFTPSNGKIRKLEATPENMQLVGSEAQMTNITARDPEDLDFIMLPAQEVEGKRCFTIDVKDKVAIDKARGELLIEMETYRIVQITVYNKEGVKSSFVKLSDFQPVIGSSKKMQPMLIVTEDFETQKLTEMRVLKVASRTDLSEKDFQLPAPQGM